jgi:hypothetical protein
MKKLLFLLVLIPAFMFGQGLKGRIILDPNGKPTIGFVKGDSAASVSLFNKLPIDVPAATNFVDYDLVYTDSIVKLPSVVCKTISLYTNIYDTTMVYVGDSISVVKEKFAINSGWGWKFLTTNSNLLYFKANKSGTKLNFYLEY